MFNAPSSAAFMEALIAGWNAVQVEALSKASMMDAGEEAWQEWKSMRRNLREQLKQYPGRGCAISFWFWYVRGFDVNFADEWTYTQMSYAFQLKPGPAGPAGFAPNANPRGRFVHIDVWLPPLPTPARPSAGPAPPPTSDSGPNYSPQMDSVEVDVYLDLDASHAKSSTGISWDTGIPEYDVGMALARLQAKQMVRLLQQGETLGYVRAR
jgi:hypothetical protein